MGKSYYSGNGPDRREPSGEYSQSFNESFNSKWISDGITQETVVFSDKLGKFIQEKGLTASQIRNVFGEIKRIQMKGFAAEKSSFYLLKPKMAYAAKRQNDHGIKSFKKYFDMAHEHVTDEKTYKNFVDFFESILAYHKAYGGKD